MKKMLTKLAFCIMLLLISSMVYTYANGYEILWLNEERTVLFYAENRLDVPVVVRVAWVNHPYGCYLHAGAVFCNHYPMVAEIQPGESTDWNMKGRYLNAGNLFEVKIETARTYPIRLLSTKSFIMHDKLQRIDVIINEIKKEKSDKNQKESGSSQPDIRPPESGVQR